jgi:hypothetical protein
MLPATRVAQMLMRGLGTVMLVLGLLFWTGNALTFITLHMLLGLALVLTLWTLAGLGLRAGVHPGLVLLAVAWGLVVPVLGMTQDQLLVGPFHGVIQVVHLLVGLAAIGLGELLARRTRMRLATRSGGPSTSASLVGSG